MRLGEWQEYLAEHFSKLSEDRASIAPNHPVFALEHGLDEYQLSNLCSEVRESVSDLRASWRYPLPWAVYATEIGYVFAGDQYWHTFENNTPEWRERGDRQWIRACLEIFKAKFNGVAPSGSWAGHRSIISWPITNAVLPCDLQRAFARLLYDLRYKLAVVGLDSPERLGEIIAGNSWNTTSRFRQFAEQPLLLGQIAAALLKEPSAVHSLVHPLTLARISEDLGRESDAKTWLWGARESVTQQISYSNRIADDRRATGQERYESELHTYINQIAPKLRLRSEGKGAWAVQLELPNYIRLEGLTREQRDLLANSQCRALGSSMPVARGKLLLDGQVADLAEWPWVNGPLLQCQQPSELDKLFQATAFLRPASSRVFKVMGSGFAQELKNPIVRPGNQYIFVFPIAAQLPDYKHFEPLALNCTNATAMLLNVPDVVSPELSDILTSLHVDQIATVQLWPIGLTPSKWDGEGSVECLTTDQFCFAVKADHELENLAIHFGSDSLQFSGPFNTSPIYIQLPQLAEGRYLIRVFSALYGQEGVDRAVMELSVREPRTWNPPIGSESALAIRIYPPIPDIIDFWNGRIEFEASGPRSRKLKSEVRLCDRNGRNLLNPKSLPPLALPATIASWQPHFDKHFKSNDDAQSAVDFAHTCHVRFWTDDLGSFQFVAEREFAPIRWGLNAASDGYLLQLIDDSDLKTSHDIFRFDLNKPALKHQLSTSEIDRLSAEPAQPGLYIAECGSECIRILIPPPVRTFQDFLTDHQIDLMPRNSTELLSLLSIVEHWSSARIVKSSVSLAIRRKAILSILQEMFRVIAGDRWGAFERRFGENEGDLLKSATPYLRATEELPLATEILGVAPNLLELRSEERVEPILDLTKRFVRLEPNSHKQHNDSPSLHWHCEFALRLASGYGPLNSWAADEVNSGIEFLLKSPGMARAARLAVMALTEVRGWRPLGHHVYEDWQW